MKIGFVVNDVATEKAGQSPFHSGPSVAGSFWMPLTNAWLFSGGV